MWDRSVVDTLDLLLHPVRLRIMHAMSGGRVLTTSDLCARLPDVPKTSVYRHVGLLAEAGVLEVAGEQRCTAPSSAATGCTGRGRSSTRKRPPR